MRIINAVLGVILISSLSACASKDTILPVPEKDMAAVYTQHMHAAGDKNRWDKRALLRRPIEEGDVELSAYVRSEKNQLELHFKKLPNPTMYMFVAPHLASDTQVPIPAYLTEFTMWESAHYALPGELSDMRHSFEAQQ